MKLFNLRPKNRIEMEIIFVTVALLAVSAVILVILAAAAGISALAGASFHTVFVNGLWILLLPPLLILYGYVAGRNRVEVKHIRTVSEKIPESFDGYRIVQISDLHLRSFRDRPRVLSSIIDKVNAQDPDLIVFTGDLVTSHPDETAAFAGELRRLKARDGVLSVTGNHDYCPYNRWESERERAEAVERVREAEKEAGWNLLDNTHVDIVRTDSSTGLSGTVSVIGVENISAMPQFESHGDLDRAMEGARGAFKILLSHDPTHWRAAVLGRTDISLMLSGHTHNAQLRILGLEPGRLVFRENSGLYTARTDRGVQQLYVNDGLGTTLFPARIGVNAEITVFTLGHGNSGESTATEN